MRNKSTGEVMTEQKNLLTLHDLEAKAVQRGWEDDGFSKELIADPAGAFGRNLQVASGGLSEADLEKVAGGTTSLTAGVLVTAVASAVTAAGSGAASAYLGDKVGW
jgi:hypothetical protein